MGEAIGQILPLGVGVALSPLPIIAVVLILGTPRARGNGMAFIVGWLLGLGVLGTAVVLVAGGADASDDGEPATWLSWTKLALGVLFLVFAVKSWRGRPTDNGPADPPTWMQAIDHLSVVKSIGLGAMLASLTPKNLMLVLAAGAAIAQTGVPTGQQLGAVAVFTVIAALGPGVPVVAYLVLGSRAAHALASLKDTLVRHSSIIMVVLMLVIGLKVFGDGLAGL